MPQEFHVVRCASCETFQVQIIKKINKYDCKMCGEKQSVRKEYGKGTSKDCRLHVQKLNQIRIVMNNTIEENIDEQECTSLSNIPKTERKSSRWSEFLTETEPDVDDEELETKYTFERPNKRKKGSEKQNISKNFKSNNPGKYTEQNSDYFDSEHKSMNQNAKLTSNIISKWTNFTTNRSESDEESCENSDKINSNESTEDIFNEQVLTSKEHLTESDVGYGLNYATGSQNSIDIQQKTMKKSKWDDFIDKNEKKMCNTGNSIVTNNLDQPKNNIFNIHDSNDNLDDLFNF